jgi:hypothetical protein
MAWSSDLHHDIVPDEWGPGPTMRLNLIVLRSASPARLASFYRSLGVPLVEEQHANGPRHYAGALTQGVLEIYPAIETRTCMFGLAVASVDGFRSAWVKSGGIGKLDILVDPDGNTVYLSAQPGEAREYQDRKRV